MESVQGKERAKKIANAQETEGGQNPEQPASPTRNGPSNTVTYKYPLKRIDATGDYLRIQIFEQLRQDDIFGLKGKFFNPTKNDKGGLNYELKDSINLTDVAKIPAINDVWNDIKSDGSIGRTNGSEQSAVEKVRKSGSIDIIYLYHNKFLIIYQLLMLKVQLILLKLVD